MRELPDSWAFAGLLDVAELVRGVTYTKPDASDIPFDGSIPVLRANNIVDRSFDLSSLVYVPARLVSDVQRIMKGDVVLATSSGSISVVGKAAQARGDMHAGFGAFCGLLRPSPTIEARYFGHFFSTEAYRSAVSSMAQGVNINNLKRGHFESLSLPLAPFNEQKRIADKLDAVLARVDACRERLDRVPAILKRFRQSVLAAATSGKLTEEWRGIQGDNGWLELTLKQVAAVIDPNPSHRYPSYERGTVPIIATEQFEGRDGYDTSRAKLVNASFYEERLAAHGFAPHDIVFARKGRLGLARRLPELEKFVFSHTIFIIRPNEQSHAAYLLWYLRNDDCIAWLLQEMNSNQGVPTLGKSFMEKLPVKLPPIEEQQEIVRRVEALFAYADRLEARYTAARAQVERLTPALLANAFRGELVPQDPNDEPASVLLERIRAARAAMSEKPRQKTKTKGKPVTTKLTTDALKEIIHSLPTDRFTFNDLRRQVSADYETLKDAVFALLSEVPASIKQVFDAEAQTMMLIRVKQ